MPPPEATLGLDTVGRGLARAALWRKERQLRAAGTPVLVIQPSRAVRSAMGLNPMQPAHHERTAEAAYTAIRGWLARPGPRTLVGGRGAGPTAPGSLIAAAIRRGGGPGRVHRGWLLRLAPRYRRFPGGRRF